MLSADLSMLLSPGQTVRISTETLSVSGKVVQTSIVEFERRYRIRFSDGSEKWVNQAIVRTFLTSN